MIQCRHLSKSFRSYQKEPGVLGSLKSFIHRVPQVKTAVNDFNFSAQPGEFIGLLGPNGAGKTTLMKMMTGIIVPSSGCLEVYGHQPHKRAKDFRKNIGLVMGQKSQLWWDIPAMDSFLLLQKYYEVDKQTFRKRLDELTELLGVQDLLKTHVRKLSLGERMKMELIASILHMPQVLFLDEPTIGLDLVAQTNIRSFLKRYQQESGTTVILTSHYMADVDALCERIIMITKGKKSFDGTRAAFEKLLGKEKFVSFRFSLRPDASHPIWYDLDPKWQMDGLQVDVRIPEASLREISQQILQNFQVEDFHTEKLPIERVMTHLIETGGIEVSP